MDLERLIDAIRRAEAEGLVPGTKTDILAGYSGKRLVGALQRLGELYAADGDSCYLEIGVYQGLTLLSVAGACTGLACYGVDNFAYFDPDEKNLGIINNHIASLGLHNVTLINKDYEDALERLTEHIGEREIGVYFVDGPHDYRSQLMCLELALPYLHDHAVIIVDDCNYRHVRQANRDFLVTHPNFKLLFEAYTKAHPHNMNEADFTAAKEGWWNGVNILIKDAEDALETMYPPTERSRLLYENEHLVHADRVAILAPQALALARSIYDKSPLRGGRALAALIREVRKHKELRDFYLSMNTYSENLPSAQFNRSVK